MDTKNFAQQLISGIDTTTERGFAEALAICIASLQDEKGLLVKVRLGDTLADHIRYIQQIARMMLHKEKANEPATQT